MISRIFIMSIMFVSSFSYCSEQKNIKYNCDNNSYNNIKLLNKGKTLNNTDSLFFNENKIENVYKQSDKKHINHFESRYDKNQINNKSLYDFEEHDDKSLKHKRRNNDGNSYNLLENDNKDLYNIKHDKDKELYDIIQRNHLNWMNLDPKKKYNSNVKNLSTKEHNNIKYSKYNISNNQTNQNEMISQFNDKFDGLNLDNTNNIIDLDEDNMEAAPVQYNSSNLYDNNEYNNANHKISLNNNKIKHNNRMKQNLYNNIDKQILSNNENIEKIIK